MLMRAYRESIQIVALEWVHTYITGFGGDPQRVTVFGQSAGAEAAAILAVSPLASELGLKRIIVESGPPIGDGWGPMTSEAGLSASNHILRANNVTSVAKLRLVHDASSIQWQSPEGDDENFSGYFYDNGGVVPRHTTSVLEMFESGTVMNVDAFIFGSNAKDGTQIYYGTCPFANGTNGDFAYCTLSETYYYDCT